MASAGKKIGYTLTYGKEVSPSDIFKYAKKDLNGLVDIIIDGIRNTIESYQGDYSLENVHTVLGYLKFLMETFQELSIGSIDSKLRDLDLNIDRVMSETKSTKALTELKKVRQSISDILNRENVNNHMSFTFISYLIDDLKNVPYIEFAFDKIPDLLSAKDKHGCSLVRKLIGNYCESLISNKYDEEMYYREIIQFIVTHDEFEISRKEKGECLRVINNCVEQLSQGEECNSEKIKKLQSLANLAKRYDECSTDVIKLANFYGISISFPEPIINRIKALDVNVLDQKRNFINDNIITIDNPGTLQLDDGISCVKLGNGNFLLGIHSVSALGYFPYDSQVINEAFCRNKAIFLPNEYQTKADDFRQLVPIFPYQFTTQIASLVPNNNCCARSYYFEIAPDGEIVGEDFIKSVVRSYARLTFDDVDQVLKHGHSDPVIHNTIHCLREVSELLEKRYENANISFPPSESQKILDFSKIFTGERVADFFARNDYPCPYWVVNRSGGISDVKNVIKSFNTSYGIEPYLDLSSSLGEASSMAHFALSGGHDDLNISHYCRPTSSLREAGSILIEKLLCDCYDNLPTYAEVENLRGEVSKKVLQLNYRNRAIRRFYRDCDGIS